MSQYLIVGKPELTRALLKERLGDLLDTAYDLNQIIDWTGGPEPSAALPPLKKGDQGYDDSHYQNSDIVWESVAAAVRFVIHKATEGIATDETFAQKFRESFGFVRRGVYHFYRFDLRNPTAQARAFLAAVADTGLTPDMGVGLADYWIDLEDPVDAAGKVIDLTPFKPYLAGDLSLFLNELLAAGIPKDRIGFYTRASWVNHWLPAGTSSFAFVGEYDLWDAGYPFTYPNTTYMPAIPWPWNPIGKQALLWQYDNGAMSWSQEAPGYYTKKVDKSIILKLRN